MFDRNTWNHFTKCKLFVLRIVTWMYKYLTKITIIVMSFLTLALAGGLLLETEWQQIYSNLQDYS